MGRRESNQTNKQKIENIQASMIHEDLFVLMLYVPVNNFSVLYWDDFLSSWLSSGQSVLLSSLQHFNCGKSRASSPFIPGSVMLYQLSYCPQQVL